MTDTDNEEVVEVEDDGEEVAQSQPMILCAGDVAILDPDYLARDSGVQGVIAVRVTDKDDVEYLDGESRLWVSASVPPGPTRGRH
jgi:hypothetical protein